MPGTQTSPHVYSERGAVLFHGLHRIRVALVGSGIAVTREAALFWAGTAVGTVAVVFAAVHILGAL
jgi:hypothetical protein